MAKASDRAVGQGAGPKAGIRLRSGQTLAAATGRPLQTLAIVVGIGALLGFLAARRGSRKAS